jgi:hypothetical protein
MEQRFDQFVARLLGIDSVSMPMPRLFLSGEIPMKVARLLLGAIAVCAMGALSPPGPVNGEFKPETTFVAGKGGKTARHGLTKAQLRVHLKSARAAEKHTHAALKSAQRVRGPHDGYRDKAIHSLHVAHHDLRDLVKQLSKEIKLAKK